MNFDRGYISAYFIGNPDRMEAELDEPYILITDKKISADLGHPAGAREGPPGRRKNFMIIAEDVEGEALATLVVNKLRGTINALAIKAPGFGDRRKAMLEDIADPDWRPGHLRGDGPQARLRDRPGPRPRPPRRLQQGRDDHHRGPRQGRRHPGPGQGRSRPRSTRRPRTTTARSSRSGSPSCPAASASSRSARAPRPSSRRRSTGSRTRSRPLGPRSRRASSRVAASP